MKKEQDKKINRKIHTVSINKGIEKMIQESIKPEEKKPEPHTIDGLNQSVTLSDGTKVLLYTLVGEKDFWQTGGKKKMTILTHSCLQRIADLCGVSKDVKYTVLTQPDAYNNYQYTFQATICMESKPNVCATEIGEANRNNVGSMGRNNPANMAQKRAYDRAVQRLLGITGLLSEEELSDNETKENMDKLSPEDSKKIAPIINQLLLAKTKEQFAKFNTDMKNKLSKDLNPEQLDYLRKLYKKTFAEQHSNTKF